jgi:uncharacterized membrane protein
VGRVDGPLMAILTLGCQRMSRRRNSGLWQVYLKPLLALFGICFCLVMFDGLEQFEDVLVLHMVERGEFLLPLVAAVPELADMLVRLQLGAQQKRIYIGIAGGRRWLE